VSLHLVLPLFLPLVGAGLALAAARSRGVQRGIGVGAAAAQLAAAAWLLARVLRDGVQAAQMGGLAPPWGITLVADAFAALMLLLTGVMGVAVALYSAGTIEARREDFGYWPMLLLVLAGVAGTFLTGDLFNLFVWFEVMLIASFVLLSLGGYRRQLEGAVKYVALNMMASLLLLSAIGLLYGMTGTLNLADLALKLHGGATTGAADAAAAAAAADAAHPAAALAPVAMLFLVAFGIKAAVFPLFSWLPASYPAPPVAVTALFAGLLTKVGVYALVRVFTLVLPPDPVVMQPLLLVLAALTMVTGVLGAVAQQEVRRLLSFHIVSQIGYLVMGLALFTTRALAGTIFFMVHIILAKSALFLVGGIAARANGSSELERMGGLAAARPALAALFLVPAFSMAGVPPLSGFFAKLVLVEAGLAEGRWAIVAVALVVSVLTLYSMLKIWSYAFWKPAPADAPAPLPAAEPGRSPALLWVPAAALGATMILLGLAAGPVARIAELAARDLLDPAAYIHAVLGGGP
jgi:multicomponent Na+:H+ antiporter subunit D